MARASYLRSAARRPERFPSPARTDPWHLRVQGSAGRCQQKSTQATTRNFPECRNERPRRALRNRPGSLSSRVGGRQRVLRSRPDAVGGACTGPSCSETARRRRRARGHRVERTQRLVKTPARPHPSRRGPRNETSVGGTGAAAAAGSPPGTGTSLAWGLPHGSVLPALDTSYERETFSPDAGTQGHRGSVGHGTLKSEVPRERPDGCDT